MLAKTAAKATVADNHIRLGGGFGCGLCGDKTRDQSGERDRVSGDESAITRCRNGRFMNVVRTTGLPPLVDPLTA